MKTHKPRIGDWFILKCSYCQEHGCCDENPCPECLEMCNRYVISANHCNKDFFFGGGWCSRNGGCRMDSTYAAVLTTDKSIVDGMKGIHHISEAIFIDPPDNTIDQPDNPVADLGAELDLLAKTLEQQLVYIGSHLDHLRDRVSKLEEGGQDE